MFAAIVALHIAGTAAGSFAGEAQSLMLVPVWAWNPKMIASMKCIVIIVM